MDQTTIRELFRAAAMIDAPASVVGALVSAIYDQVEHTIRRAIRDHGSASLGSPDLFADETFNALMDEKLASPAYCRTAAEADSPQAWLANTVEHFTINRLRRSVAFRAPKTTGHLDDGGDRDFLELARDPTLDADERLIEEEHTRELKAHVAALRPDDRLLLGLMLPEALPLPSALIIELARLHGVSEAQVRRWLEERADSREAQVDKLEQTLSARSSRLDRLLRRYDVYRHLALELDGELATPATDIDAEQLHKAGSSAAQFRGTTAALRSRYLDYLEERIRATATLQAEAREELQGYRRRGSGYDDLVVLLGMVKRDADPKAVKTAVNTLTQRFRRLLERLELCCARGGG